MSFRTSLLASVRPLRQCRCPLLVARPVPPSLHRTLHSSSSTQAGGGLTNLFDVDPNSDPARPRIQVNKLNDQGFHLSDGLIIPGGVIFLDDRAFLWDVDPVGADPVTGRGLWEEWKVDRFAIFETILPRPGAWWLVVTLRGKN